MTMMPSFLTGKLGDDVLAGKLPYRSIRSERIDFDVVARKVGEDELLGFRMPRASRLAGTDGDELLHVLKSAGGVDVLSGTGRSCGGLRLLGSGTLRRGWGSVRFTGARRDRSFAFAAGKQSNAEKEQERESESMRFPRREVMLALL